VLDKNELITDVTVPPLNGRKAAYLKVTSRSVDDWPALGVAVSFNLAADAIDNPIVVVSAATEKVTRMAAAERVLQGARPDDPAIKHAGDAAADEAEILADGHGSAAYKRELLRVYLGRAVRRALGQATEPRA
jgi:aerobic carbon-monoxide dehydrogenase medium subunit